MKGLKIIFLLWMTGCDVVETAAESEPVNGDVEVGAEIFALYCAECHGSDAAGGRAPSLLSGEPVEMSYEENVEEIRWRMRREGLEGVLSDQDIDDLIAFLFVFEILAEIFFETYHKHQPKMTRQQFVQK